MWYSIDHHEKPPQPDQPYLTSGRATAIAVGGIEGGVFPIYLG